MSRLSLLGDTALELVFQIAAGLIIGLLGWEILKLGARTFREPGGIVVAITAPVFVFTIIYFGITGELLSFFGM
tara:strand:+ start:478 stop:699 length:222 start_codon:yes stop_codon:yes gene_type:complete